MKKWVTFCEYILFFAFLGILLGTKEKFSLFLALPILVLIVFFTKKIKVKNYPLFLFLVAFLIRIITICCLKVEVVDDFKTMWDASNHILTGRLDLVHNLYFETFSYQLGHVLYQALLLKLIPHMFFLKVMNSLITSLIVVFLYLLSRQFFKEETARMVSLGYLFYFYPLYLNSVLTNQHLPILIDLIVIFLLLRKENTKKLAVFIGILLAIANFLRTESIVFLLGIVLFQWITKEKERKQTISFIVVMISIYWTMTFLFSQAVLQSPLKMDLKNHEPYWKFYCGLSYENEGRYNEKNQEIYFQSENPKELVLQRIKEEKEKLPILWMKKEIILWTQANYDLRIESIPNEEVYVWFQKVNQGYLNLFLLLLVISLYPDKKRKKLVLLIKIILGIYLGVYLWIEISPRYAYILHTLSFLVIGIGVERIEDWIQNRRI